MALHWDVRDIADKDTVTTSPSTRGKTDKEWHPITHALIMGSMVIGIGHITEKNYKKVARRYAQYQMLGALLGSQVMPKIYITEEDVRKHIGLKMNVADITDAAWHKHLITMIDRDCASIQNGRYNTYNTPDGMFKEDDLNVSAYDVFERLWELKQKEGK